MRLLEAWDDQPAWRRLVEGVAIAVAVIVVLNIVTLLVGAESAVTDLAFWLVLLSLFALSVWIGGVRLGGRGQARLFRRSMKQSRVLDGADRPSWRREIARRRSFRPRARRAARWFAVALPVLAVVPFVSALVTDDWITAALAVVPLLVLAAVIGCLVLVVVPRTRRRLDVLEAELAADDGQRNARTIAAYEGHADAYAQIVGDTSFEGSVEAMRQLVAVCPPSASVLEVGSGTGHDADFLEQQGLRVRRTDATESFLRLQRARGKHAESLNVLTDALGGPYDAIQALCVLIHVEHQQLADVLASMRAALREGGHLLMSMRTGEGSDQSGDWFTALWPVEALEELLATAGFVLVWQSDHEGRGADRWATLLARRR